MINSHYIPQLILRHFCVENKIKYCDIASRKIDLRNTKSVFSERGYYPVDLEKNLCKKIESQFANLLNTKIICSRNRLTLTSDEMLLLKKYLIISIFRYKADELELEKNPILDHLSKEQKHDIFGNFYDNINKILDCQNKEQIFELTDLKGDQSNISLLAHVRDILYSYIVFVKTNNCGEDFIIPDRGWTSYKSVIHIQKITGTLDLAMQTGDPFLFQLVQMMTPHDYCIFPVSRNIAILTMSSFFKLCMAGSPYNIKFPDEAPTLSKVLGFGSAHIISAPKVKSRYGKENEYTYEIKQLSYQDVTFLNSLLLADCEKYFAFADVKGIKRSLEYTMSLDDSRDYSFVVQES